MIDTSSGGALMNKTPEEAWEMIEIVADANQHFNTRAKVKGVYEIAPSESTMLAKSLVDIVATLKEIKEGQQPLPNPKGGLNALNDKPESEEDAATTNDKKAVQQLCEMLIEVTDTEERDTGEIFDFYEEFDSDYKEEEVEEGKSAEGRGTDTETQNLQRETLSINTVSDNKKNEEELPIKCEDPGPCLVTCRIKGFEIPGCLCDPRAC
ncbi:hypothetical protein PIB30_067075 [Stylosanthes scabra]|uniref:Uncharacterized protein n=1 Tax=Stylosanthes scabra TaxID=79078 RepID=A0ABU6ZL95_9FABA|nr:hypothetical protein [Stylosanthes scabra]